MRRAPACRLPVRSCRAAAPPSREDPPNIQIKSCFLSRPRPRPMEGVLLQPTRVTSFFDQVLMHLSIRSLILQVIEALLELRAGSRVVPSPDLLAIKSWRSDFSLSLLLIRICRSARYSSNHTTPFTADLTHTRLACSLASLLSRPSPSWPPSPPLRRLSTSLVSSTSLPTSSSPETSSSTSMYSPMS